MDDLQLQDATASAGEQIIVFRLGDELFGLNISYINEISELRPMNFVPRSPEFIAGVINCHGRIVAVHDLGSFFSLPAPEDKSLARIIILVPKGYELAFLVDSVKEITFIPEESEVLNPMEGQDFKNIYIEKVVCFGENPINIIDIGKLLADLEDYFKEVSFGH